jgi:hypothetical protein
LRVEFFHGYRALKFKEAMYFKWSCLRLLIREVHSSSYGDHLGLYIIFKGLLLTIYAYEHWKLVL